MSKFNKNTILFCSTILLVGSIFISKIYVDNNKKYNEDNQEEIVQQEIVKDNIIEKEESKVEYHENLVLVNRDNSVESGYSPSDLVIPNISSRPSNSMSASLKKEAAWALEEMFIAAKEDGLYLKMISGYRDYKYQNNLYKNKIEKSGKEYADKFVAQPGNSEHHTGLAVDILSSEYSRLRQDFEYTDTFKWLSENCSKHGFIIRYPKGKEDITGYQYEPWHFRYVGKKDAKEIMEKDLTLEEYLRNAVI